MLFFRISFTIYNIHTEFNFKVLPCDHTDEYLILKTNRFHHKINYTNLYIILHFDPGVYARVKFIFIIKLFLYFYCC